MVLSKQRKFGLVCLILAFIVIGYSYSLFNDAEDSAKESEVDVNFVTPPSEPPAEEDEFADLERELDVFE